MGEPGPAPPLFVCLCLGADKSDKSEKKSNDEEVYENTFEGGSLQTLVCM